MTVVERIRQLAHAQGRTLTFLCGQIGLKSRTYFTDIEKNGREIPEKRLERIAEILGVSTDYLKGNTDDPSRAVIASTSTVLPLNEKENRLIFAYRSQPEMQPEVDMILGLRDDDNVLVYSAARSTDNHPPRIETISKERWEAIKNAPETDDDLM